MIGAEAETYQYRIVRRKVLICALAISLFVNPALADKKSTDAPNILFGPICYTDQRDLVVLTGQVTREFKQAMLKIFQRTLEPGAIGPDYITDETIWDMTTRVAEGIYEKQTGRRLPKDRSKLGTNKCAFIRKYVLAVKNSHFEPKYRFRPICHAGRHIGLAILTGQATWEYTQWMLYFATHFKLKGSKEPSSISTELIWNMTTKFAEYTYEKRTGKRLSRDRGKTGSNKCKFIRKYVLEKTKAR